LSNLKKNLEKFSSEYELVVVNDGSIDRTLDLLNQNPDLYHKLLNHQKNKGKGEAVKTALKKCEGEYIFFHDADLEYDSNDIIDFINLINFTKPDLIIGSRKNYKKFARSHNIYNYFGNRFISFLFNIINNTTFSDIYSCYVCYKKNLIDPDNLVTVGWEQHAEILTKVVNKSKLFYEIPINYNGRTIEEGKKIRPYHMISVIVSLFRFKIFK
jgi:glycosyltransferase involved in cell wall biosynthesis